MSKFHIHKTARIGNLGEKQMNSLAGELAEMTIESDLRGQMQNNIKRLRDMGTYRGRRHAMGLPVRGQRTRTQVSLVYGVRWGGFWNFSWLTNVRQIMTARKFNRVDRLK
jgi:ribosomal protein S13